MQESELFVERVSALLRPLLEFFVSGIGLVNIGILFELGDYEDEPPIYRVGRDWFSESCARHIQCGVVVHY